MRHNSRYRISHNFLVQLLIRYWIPVFNGNYDSCSDGPLNTGSIIPILNSFVWVKLQRVQKIRHIIVMFFGTPTIAIDDMLHPSKHYLLFYIIIDSIEYIESVVRTNERTVFLYCSYGIGIFAFRLYFQSVVVEY